MVKNNHTKCRNTSITMPSRLTELSHPPGGLYSPYRRDGSSAICCVTLNYCWGGNQVMKCLSSNLSSYTDAIPFDEQQPTIKEVAKVCHNIGLSYLWVDALYVSKSIDTKRNTTENCGLALLSAEVSFRIFFFWVHCLCPSKVKTVPEAYASIKSRKLLPSRVYMPFSFPYMSTPLTKLGTSALSSGSRLQTSSPPMMPST